MPKQPLIDILCQQYPESSKRTLKSWIKWGRIYVDGKPHTKAFIEEGQVVTLGQKEVPGPFPILYSDRWLIVINKPAHLLSVPADKPEDSALSLLRDHFKSTAIFAVHRLDQEASGVLLFARGLDAKHRLAEMFGAHALQREYAAIVEGRVKEESGTWQSKLEELENFNVIVSDEGRDAITHFKRDRVSAKFSFLSVTLETGRKHQIRVHCREAGHPIIGDARYDALTNPIKRLGLHAKKLSFKHPFTEKEMSFSAPPPKSFKKLGLSVC